MQKIDGEKTGEFVGASAAEAIGDCFNVCPMKEM